MVVSEVFLLSTLSEGSSVLMGTLRGGFSSTTSASVTMDTAGVSLDALSS